MSSPKKAAKTAKLAQKLADAMNAGSIGKAYGAAAATPDSMYPLADMLVRIDRAVTRNGKKIRALYAASVTPPAPVYLRRPEPEAFPTQAADDLLARIDAALVKNGTVK